MADVPLQDACNLDGGKGFQRKDGNKTPGFRPAHFFSSPVRSTYRELIPLLLCLGVWRQLLPHVLHVFWLPNFIERSRLDIKRLAKLTGSMCRVYALAVSSLFIRQTFHCKYTDKAAEWPKYAVYCLHSQYHKYMALFQLGHKLQCKKKNIIKGANMDKKNTK